MKIYFKKNGYVVCPKLISPDKIDQLLKLYQEYVVPSKSLFFRQNTNRYEANHINRFGHVIQSFLDVHDYQEIPEFSTCAKEIFCSNEIHQALNEITGSSGCNLMQTMFFDANTETQPHQDCWYLDSVPGGYLLAAWIALEDIEEEAGRFFVLPRTNTVDLHSDTPNLSHSQWLERIQDYVDSHQDLLYAPALKKGDVLFWNSHTIHGALPTINHHYSRKSLTAHYLPSEYSFGNLFVRKENIRYKKFNGVQYYRNQPDYSLVNQLKFRIKTGVYDSPFLLKSFRKIQSIFS